MSEKLEKEFKSMRFGMTPQGFVGVEIEFFAKRKAEYFELLRDLSTIYTINKLLVRRYDEMGLSPLLAPVCSEELSACQLEMKTAPAHYTNVSNIFERDVTILKDIVRDKFNAKLVAEPVANFDALPRSVVNTPRYLDIKRRFSSDTDGFSFMLGVTALHIHIGAQDERELINIFKSALIYTNDTLISRASSRQKLFMRHIRATPFYDLLNDINSLSDYYDYLILKGCGSMKDNYDLARISRYGTVELRLSDSTDKPEDLERIISALKKVQVLA